MNDTRTTMTTYVGGDPVEIPATIAGVRAALTEDQRAAFDEEIAHTHALELPHVLIRWALPPEAHDEDEAAFRRLEAGDFT
ncbi:hypothetical protein SAMN06297387_12866 [Streptomyces zhaozhouensis]|uniref:Uncharacterized protein n=1 Tax=Streptomyces zhaozhouensis TaxID=1300267 RepID=A0A286E850_9ACTN|nr:hypothetical protein [Streptomyces zhaozhouensis]SOD67098.1 hypothetical protein SAMN06297387_12866 [Streptomyces zhaozhouensis]